MKVEFNSLHWDNVDKDMLKAHQSVMSHFDIPVNYHSTNTNHGFWMQQVIGRSNSDVIVIIEPDCIILDKEKVLNYIKYAYRNETFVGIAQVSNHIHPKSHIYAAPGFYVMSSKAYNKLGRPSFTEERNTDTAEAVCYLAEDKGMRYRSLMPTCFEKESSEGLWPLGSLGYYGIGTVFDNAVYHLYQSRMAENIELFVKRCDEVINGTFTTDGFHSSTTFNYKGKIVS
jgi:hypothetical protein